jgi:hypothetical protein
MTIRSGNPRSFDPDVVDQQIADRFKGQFMIHRGIFESESLRELEAIFALPSEPSATELDCAAQSPEQSTRTQDQGK